MADKRINELDSASSIYDNDLFVLEQNGNAMSLSGSLLKQYIDRDILSVQINPLAATAQMTASFSSSTGTLTLGLPVGAGIASFTEDPSSEGSNKVYKITFETPYGGQEKPPVYVNLKDGKGITNVTYDHSVPSAEEPGVAAHRDFYTINFDDGTTGEFVVYNGNDGSGSAGSATPLMDGTGSAGSAVAYAREDHRHPSDTTRVAVNQGVAHAGKFMVVGADGNIAPTAMTEWSGGSY